MTAKQWKNYIPTTPGKYRIRDTVFGHKTYVRVYVGKNDELYVRPRHETEAHGVLLIATPTWWEWKSVRR